MPQTHTKPSKNPEPSDFRKPKSLTLTPLKLLCLSRDWFQHSGSLAVCLLQRHFDLAKLFTLEKEWARQGETFPYTALHCSVSGTLVH